MDNGKRITFLDSVATKEDSFIFGKTYFVNEKFAAEMIRCKFAKEATEITATKVSNDLLNDKPKSDFKEASNSSTSARKHKVK